MAGDQDQVLNEFPPFNFPVIFADGVQSIGWSAANIKFYLMRIEPSSIGSGKTQQQSFAQVVMPMDGFLSAFAFFEAAIEQLKKAELVKQERIDELRKAQSNTAWNALS